DPAHLRGRQEDVAGAELREERMHRAFVAQIELAPRAGEDLLEALPLESAHQGCAHQAAVAGYEHLRVTSEHRQDVDGPSRSVQEGAPWGAGRRGRIGMCVLFECTSPPEPLLS